MSREEAQLIRNRILPARDPMSPQVLPFNTTQNPTGEPTINIQTQAQLKLKDVFGGAPTEDLYRIRQLIDDLLATRPDAKR